MAKKQNVIAYANLTMALESPSLIGMLMRAQTPDWPCWIALPNGPITAPPSLQQPQG